MAYRPTSILKLFSTKMCVEFLPHDAMHKRGLCRRAVSVGLSVRLGVCHICVFCLNQ